MSKAVSIDLLNEVAAKTRFSVAEISRDVNDVFNGCIGLGYSEKEAQNMCVQYCGLINSYTHLTPSSFLDLLRGSITATEGAFKPDTIVYPGQSPQKPKRKPQQRKKPKPKNRTVYR